MTDRELLLEVLARQDRIEAQLARLLPKSRLARRDRDRLEQWVPALFRVFGDDHEFRTGEAIAHSALRPLAAGLAKTPKAQAQVLGRLLSRGEGEFFGGTLRVECVGREGHARLWKISTLGFFGSTRNDLAA